MALTIACDTPYGISCDEVHTVILETRLQKEIAEDGTKSFTISYAGRTWLDADKYAAGNSPILGLNFSFALDTGTDADQHNILKQCYLDLKTQEGYTDAIDA